MPFFHFVKFVCLLGYIEYGFAQMVRFWIWHFGMQFGCGMVGFVKDAVLIFDLVWCVSLGFICASSLFKLCMFCRKYCEFCKLTLQFKENCR